MTTLLLRFVVWLRDSDKYGFSGPQFHRWLPDGENDAIQISVQPNITVQLWLERRGFVERGFIRYDHARREVDPGIMSNQGRLQAGNLRGRILIPDVSPDIRAALESTQVGSQAYVAFGK